MSLTLNSLDLVAKASSIFGFNIFLQPAERSAKDFDEVIELAAEGKLLTLSSGRPRFKEGISMSAQALSGPSDGPPVAVRRAKPEDAAACGRVCFDAFYKISTDHGFPPDFPSPDVAAGLLSMMFSHPGFYGVVAESEGRVVAATALMSDRPSPVSGRSPSSRASRIAASAGR